MIFCLIFLPCLSFRLRIIHTNDLHSQLSGTGPDGDYSRNLGGYPRISYLIDKFQNQHPQSTLTVDAGDFFGGSMFHLMSGSNFFDFSPEFEILDYWKYDAVTIGNHELDGGLKLLGDIVRKSNFPIPIVLTNTKIETFEIPDIYEYRSNFSFPNSYSASINIRNEEAEGENSPYFVPFVLKKLKNGEDILKVAIIGILGPNSMRVIDKSNRRGIRSFGFSKLLGEDINEYSYYIANVSNTIRQKFDVDFIISLSHSGYPEDLIFLNTLYKISPSKRLIDCHISGHTHNPYYFQHDLSGSIVAQTTGYGFELGYLDLFFDQTSGKLILMNEGNHIIPINSSIPDDPIMLEKIRKYSKVLDSVFMENEYMTNMVQQNVHFPIGMMTKLETRSEILDWFAYCMHNETNRIMRIRKERQIDMFLFSHEFGRINKEIAMKYENGTEILFSDIFRWFGVGTISEPINLVNWMGEDLVIFYLRKEDVKMMVNVWMILRNIVDYLEMTLGGIQFERNKYGIPFLDSQKFGLIYNFKSLGKDFVKIEGKFLKVAARKSLCEFLRVIPHELTHGFVTLESYDRFGRKAKPVSSGLKETLVFMQCLKSVEEGLI